jgi:signal transduction histidine kinase
MKIMKSFKKLLYDYTLYILFAVSLLRFAMLYMDGSRVRMEELCASAFSTLLILVFIYIQWDAQRSAKAEAKDLVQANRGIAKAIKNIRDAKQNAANKRLEVAQGAIQHAEEGQASAEQAMLLPEQANQTKSDFMANMSHEIRTPMNAIVGLTHILQTTKLDVQQKQCVDVLQTSADGLMRMINDMLDIDKMLSAELALEEAPFSMTTLLDQVVSVMSVEAQKKNISLISHYEPGLYKTYIGDVERIRQIVLNLVGNAVKFTKARGKVSVLFANGGKGNGKKSLTVTVTDTGIGIARDKIGLIFDKFVQADSSITRKFGGTGLGLAISQALAQRMGGEITVTSVLGQGSSFTLHLSLPVQATVNDAEKHYQDNIIYLDMQANAARKPIFLGRVHKIPSAA